ncbi:hypothetical protein IX293_002297 [Fusobacterium necrophorum]|nr:hypothetical protein [Fusobacterium necrophorum]MBR8824022.1 hypothetical protein [Fusobacterium necrophorum]
MKEKKEDIAKAFEGVSKDLGYPVTVIYTDPSNSPQLIGIDKDGNRYIKAGTAYVDEKTGIHHILINSKSEGNKTKADRNYSRRAKPYYRKDRRKTKESF